jgi:ADP-ribose pyrophosphatase YjhB (NUDIX family)
MDDVMTHPIKLIADTAVIAEGKVLMLRYADPETHDNEAGWFLPDDLAQYLEHPEKAAARILAEQTGISGAKLELSHVESFSGGDGSWHLAFHYKAELPAVPVISSGDGIEEARWFSLDELPESGEVAHHGWALGTIRRIMS